MRRLLALFFLACCPLFVSCQTTSHHSGVVISNFVFDEWDGPAIKVFSAEAETAAPDAPIVFVMHGVRRNADDYRDNWIDIAREYQLRVYAPEFDSKNFPGAKNYNLGGVNAGASHSAFDAVEPLFEYLGSTRGITNRGYIIFGHSAGAQFVHRFVCFADTSHMNLAIAANAGWYTLVNADEAWPYGLKNIPGEQCSASDWLSKPLLVLLGDQDTDANDPYLRRTPEAMAQGAHRLARGLNFLQGAREYSDAHNLPVAWRFEVVENIGHDDLGMAREAGVIIGQLGTNAPKLANKVQ